MEFLEGVKSMGNPHQKWKFEGENHGKVWQHTGKRWKIHAHLYKSRFINTDFPAMFGDTGG